MDAERSRGLHIAIPCFGEEVAPRFETARRIRVWTIDGNRLNNHSEFCVEGMRGPIDRVRLLILHGANVLICNGIDDTYRKMIKERGCKVVQGIAGSVIDALFGFLAEKIVHDGLAQPLVPGPKQPDISDLVEWTEALLRSLGWQVERETGAVGFPVDMIATCLCPVCEKPIRIAVCCGAHIYRVDEEISEFHRVTSNRFNARLYFHQRLPGVERACQGYGIQLIDPVVFADLEAGNPNPLSVLESPISGHANLNIERIRTNQQEWK